MSEAMIVALLKFAVEFGFDATIAIVKGIKVGSTAEEAIAALEVAKTKTGEQYLAEAKAAKLKA